jgi:two-component system nitrogen regulation sensor histidine kinase NtrY
MAELQGFKNQQKQRGSRTRRYILASIIFLLLALAATQIFLQQTSVGSPRFIKMTFLLYTATVVVVLALLILATVLGRNLIKLYFERKSGLVGSGFKSKMVRTFIVLSLLPAVLLFLLAYSLLSSSIEQWFRAAPAQMMENSRLLAQQYYAEVEKDAKYFAANIAGFPARRECARSRSRSCGRSCASSAANMRWAMYGFSTIAAGSPPTPDTRSPRADIRMPSNG